MRFYFAILLAGCSTTHLIPETTSDVHTPALHLPANIEILEPAFPTRVADARLPSADRLRIALRGEGVERATARVRVCVAPSGAVTEVSLDTPTGIAALDAAIAHDVAGWTYAAYQAPATVRVCVPATMTYMP